MKNLITTGRITSFVLFFVVIVIAGGCSKDSDDDGNNNNNNGGTNSPAANEVLMRNNSFSPGSLTVTVGTKVTWTNKDGMSHTVTSNTGLFDSGIITDNGVFTFTFTTAGTFPYFCQLHAGMSGTVVVREQAANPGY